MKKNGILYIAIILLILLTNNSFSFAMVSDIQNHWAKDDILYLMEKGYIQGYNDGTFKPNQNVTRGEFLKMVNNVYGFTEITPVPFIDVRKDDWYYTEVGKALAAGYVSGYTDGTIRPNRLITREEAAKIIATLQGMAKGWENIKLDFTDNNQIGDWAKDYVKAMKYQGYMKGYQDGSFRPKRQITRGETAKILADISRRNNWNSNTSTDGTQYLVQVGSYNNLEFAKKELQRLNQAGFNDAFIIEDDKYYVIAGRFSTEEEARIFKTIVASQGFDTFITTRSFVEGNLDKPVKPIYVVESINKTTKYKEFINLVDVLPNPKDIRELVASDMINLERAKKLYDNLSQEEKRKIPNTKVNKFKEVESKIESLKTPIVSNSKVSIAQAQAWAIRKGAHKRFIDVAPFYWEYGRITGINPEILYAQGAKETNFGRYTGQVRPEMNNWAGIRILEANGDSNYDYEIFSTPEDGVRAHFNHMGIYCGVDPIGEPHPRWYKTNTASWAGKIKYVEDLGGRWAPNPDYGISIIRDYVRYIYNTPVPVELDLKKALEFSQRVDQLLEGEFMIIEILEEYYRLTEYQKSLVPYNIKEKIDKIKFESFKY